MKIPVEFTIATGQFENAKPTIEIEVPDELTPQQQYAYLWRMFHDINKNIKKHELSQNDKRLLALAQAEGADIDNNAYLGTDMDRTAELTENFLSNPELQEDIKSGKRSG